jgi:hypothetical protein
MGVIASDSSLKSRSVIAIKVPLSKRMRCPESAAGCRLRRHTRFSSKLELWSVYAAAFFWGEEARCFATPFLKKFTSSEVTSSAFVQVMQCGPCLTTTSRAPLISLARPVRARSANVGSGTGGRSLPGPDPACFRRMRLSFVVCSPRFPRPVDPPLRPDPAA